MNGLANESSLYLQSHATHPVQWIPWSESAIQESKHKLLLISIGYASCHWCHVMSRDIFEDDEVAKIMNDHFTCIKVDREQRPDLDRAYMTAASALLQGQVGWPLNVVALPDGRPIWASTYLAKAPWIYAMNELAKAAMERPDELTAFAQELNDLLRASQRTMTDEREDFRERYLSTRDETLGGMGMAPKFPNPHFHRVVARHLPEARAHVAHTWHRIAHSGTYDQQLGGIMRYAVHRDWSVPHFEKMAYDQGAWLGFCAEHAVGNPQHQPEIQAHATHLIQWLRRDFQLENGLFASSISAEVDGAEGAHLLWSDDEIRACLSDTAAPFLEQLKQGARRVDGRWHLHHPGKPDALWREAVTKLSAQAIQRAQPQRDDQSICAWNAAVLTGLAEWHMLCEDDDTWVIHAAQAHMQHFFADGAPKHLLYPNGKDSGPAFLDDMAMTIHMQIRMAQMTMDASWLAQAEHWTDWTIQAFHHDGTFLYQTQESLFWEPEPWEDDIMPSPLGLMALNLIELAHLRGRQDYHELATKLLDTVPERLTHPQQCYSWVEVAHVIGVEQEHLLIRSGEARPEMSQLKRIWGPSFDISAYGQLCSMTTCKFEYQNPKDLNHG